MAKISHKMARRIESQIASEQKASNFYAYASSYCTIAGMPAAAQLFAEQSEEEHEHAKRFRRYLVDCGRLVTWQCVPDSPENLPSNEMQNVGLQTILRMAIESEESITEGIVSIARMADDEEDVSTANFIDWFVQEQVEEEALMRGLQAALISAGNNSGIFELMIASRKKSNV